MAFRDRGGQQPSWDFDSEGAPPIWDEPAAPPRNARGKDDSFGELPAWPKSNRAETRWEEEEVPARPVPATRQQVGRSEQQTHSARWPSLRDSLQGHSGSTQNVQRSSRPTNATSSSAPVRSSRPERYDRPPVEDDDSWPEETNPVHAEALPYDEPRQQPRKTVGTRTQTRARRSVAAQSRPAANLTTRLGSLTAGQDTVLVGSIGISIFSLLVMAAVVSTRTDSVSPWFATHINAAGNADRWGTSDAIWRLPLTTTMFSLASILAAIYIGKREVFASRFLLASIMLIHLLSWMGLIRLLW